MKTFLLIATICLMACQQTSTSKVITNEELMELLKETEVQLVDVRTPGEWSEGIIHNAKKINYRDANFLEQMNQLDKDKPVVLYCAAGGRSAGAAEKIKTLGFKAIYDLGEGFRGWKAAGMPVSEQ